jgi:hypothetical protein
MATSADDHPRVGETSLERLLVHIATLARSASSTNGWTSASTATDWPARAARGPTDARVARSPPMHGPNAPPMRGSHVQEPLNGLPHERPCATQLLAPSADLILRLGQADQPWSVSERRAVCYQRGDLVRPETR